MDPTKEAPAGQLLTVSEVATRLRLGRSKTYELVMSGAIASVKIGRARRVPEATLSFYMAGLTNA